MYPPLAHGSNCVAKAGGVGSKGLELLQKPRDERQQYLSRVWAVWTYVHMCVQVHVPVLE